MTQVRSIHASQILDSRGNPTLEVEIYLNDNTFGRASVPSGASTGEHEAVELRDKGSSYMGKSVLKAIENVNHLIAGEVVGMDALDIVSIDAAMLKLDGTNNKRSHKLSNGQRIWDLSGNVWEHVNKANTLD